MVNLAVVKLDLVNDTTWWTSATACPAGLAAKDAALTEPAMTGRDREIAR